MLGHAGAHVPQQLEVVPQQLEAPYSAGAPLIVALLIANRALNSLEIERRSIALYNTGLRSSLIRSSYASFAVSDLHFATVYGLRTDLGGCKIPGGRMPPDPPISFCTLRGVRTNVVCPCCALATAMSWLRHWLRHWLHRLSPPNPGHVPPPLVGDNHMSI